MKKAIGTILFVIYSIIAIVITVLILTFNEYNCSEIGGYTVYIVKDDSLEPEYEKGTILLIESTSDKHVQVGDELFFYKIISSSEYELVSKTLVQKIQQGRHIVYDVGDGDQYDTNYFIGKTEDVTIIDAPWGTILSILESKWGYLFCIVIVSLLLFLQQVFDLIIEIKYGAYKRSKPVAKSGTARAGAVAGAKVAVKTKTVTTAEKAPVTENTEKEEKTEAKVEEEV